MTAILQILKRIPPFVWVLLAVVVAFMLLRGPLTRAWATLKQLAMRDGGNYDQGVQGATPEERDARTNELNGMAQEAYAQLSAGFPNPVARESALAAISEGTNDTELRIVAKRYKMLSRDKSLYQAVNDAWMAFSDVDERLMARLANIAMM